MYSLIQIRYITSIMSIVQSTTETSTTDTLAESLADTLVESLAGTLAESQADNEINDKPEDDEIQLTDLNLDSIVEKKKKPKRKPKKYTEQSIPPTVPIKKLFKDKYPLGEHQSYNNDNLWYMNILNYEFNT